jgi:hypothetical protein
MLQDPHHCIRITITNKNVLWHDLKFSQFCVAEDSGLQGYDAVLIGK